MRAKFFKTLAVFALFSGLVLPVAGAAVSAPAIRILALGDSLTAGYGLARGDGFPAQLQRKLVSMGYDARVLNAGVSGDTSAGGLARLDWALSDRPSHAIIELGANDGLRGLEPDAMRANLDAIIRRLRAANVAVLLTGMRAPPNFGTAYVTEFNRVFPDLAKKYGVVFYPFFLTGVVSRPELNLGDGIHPNRDGVAVIVDRIAPFVVRLLEKPKQE